MRLYISGIEGTGMGPLALMAKQAGIEVCGSDKMRGAIHDELVRAGVEIEIGEQNGEFLRSKLNEGIDWFLYTSALPETHAELVLAKEFGIKCTKRDDLTAFLVKKLGLKMIAVAGTHGKTTTTAMIVWAALKLGLPVAYIVGTTLRFAPSGAYHEGDKYFVYEADEYDRNFLKFHPWLSVIPSASYDHPDIYPTREDYEQAFDQFKAQSEEVIEMGWSDDKFDLAGEIRRKDAGLAAEAVMRIWQDLAVVKPDDFEEIAQKIWGKDVEESAYQIADNRDEMSNKIVQIMNEFPGVGRRFERLRDGLYTDYAHHPEEIAATMGVALDEAKICGKKGVVAVYQPHQNTRQHEVFNGYRDAFVGAEKVFWLPTYLVREREDLAILAPEDFTKSLSNSEMAETAEMDNELAEQLRQYLEAGFLVVLMTAGPADEWLRSVFGKEKLEI